MMLSPSERYRQVATLHAANINQGFLATLGVPFLSLMYQAIDEGDQSVLLTEESAGQVVGFVSGAVGMGPIYRQMLRHPLRLTISLLPSLACPGRILRIFETLRYSRGRAKPSGWPDGELLSIAVDPTLRGSGLSERLYRRLEDHFSKLGLPAFRIVVGKALEPAHRYYQRMGATPIGTIEVHSGEKSVVYVHRLADSSGRDLPASIKSENS